MLPGDVPDPDLRLFLEVLIQRHQEQWVRFAQQILGNRADAEDVLQEAVMKMLARDRRFGSLDQARMYLGRVIANTAIESYHRQRSHRRRSCPMHEQTLAATRHGNPESALQEAEEWSCRARMLDHLGDGLASLPPKQHQALYITVMDPSQASLREAGDVYDIPYSTLRHRSVQGLRRLKRYLHRALRAAPAKLALA